MLGGTSTRNLPVDVRVIVDAESSLVLHWQTALASATRFTGNSQRPLPLLRAQPMMVRRIFR
jgi:hypothetical protein